MKCELGEQCKTSDEDKGSNLIFHLSVKIIFSSALWVISFTSVAGGTMGVGENQRGVWGVLLEAQAVGVTIRVVAGYLLLPLKQRILPTEPPHVSS